MHSQGSAILSLITLFYNDLKKAIQIAIPIFKMLP
jgi:hypothetical protein